MRYKVSDLVVGYVQWTQGVWLEWIILDLDSMKRPQFKGASLKRAMFAPWSRRRPSSKGQSNYSALSQS